MKHSSHFSTSNSPHCLSMTRTAVVATLLLGTLVAASPDGGHGGAHGGSGGGHGAAGVSGVSGGIQGGAGGGAHSGGGGGYGGGYGHFAHPKYNFEYSVKDYSGNDFGHQEDRDGYRANGQYSVQLPDGRLQTVQYFTDEWGYHANVGYTGQAKHPARYGPAVTFFKGKGLGGGGGGYH